MIELIKKDTLLRGLILGLVAPIIGFYLFKLIQFNYFDMEKFFTHIYENKLLAPVISICVILNAALFFYFIQNDKFYTARGLILGTFVYGGIIIYLKFGT